MDRPVQESAAEIFRKLVDGDTSALSRAITLVENNRTDLRATGLALVDLAYTQSPKQDTVRIGITGVPGAGKSSLIEKVGLAFANEDKRVAVLAIDPTSPISSGSILGDKTRMDQLAANPACFVRPSPTGGQLGGARTTTLETILLCEAAGFTHIFVETVGVGQSETDLKSITDVFVLLLISGAGDELQGIKRGVMEMSDIVCLTKEDGSNVAAVKLAKSQLRGIIKLLQPGNSGWRRRVVSTSVVLDNISDLTNALSDYVEFIIDSGYLDKNRRAQDLVWFQRLSEEMVRSYILSHPELQALSTELTSDVEAGLHSPISAAEKWFGTAIKLLND